MPLTAGWNSLASVGLPQTRWPRWHGVGKDGFLVAAPNKLMSPERYIRARWMYGGWIDLLARAGGYVHRQQWCAYFGGGVNAAVSAWSDCHDLRVIASARSGADVKAPRVHPDVGWLTRAGWYVAGRYGLPPVVRQPRPNDRTLVQALCLLDFTFTYHLWVWHRRGPDVEDAGPSAFPEDAAKEFAVPQAVIRLLSSDTGTAGGISLHIGRHWDAAGDLDDRRIQLYAVDAAPRREPRVTVRWLLDLQSSLSVTAARDIPMTIITPSAERAAWWRQHERLLAVNQWPPSRLSLAPTDVRRLLARGYMSTQPC